MPVMTAAFAETEEASAQSGLNERHVQRRRKRLWNEALHLIKETGAPRAVASTSSCRRRVGSWARGGSKLTPGCLLKGTTG